MNALLRSWRNASGNPVSEVVYYIGDSGTDIECLTEGGTTGIVIAEDRNSALMGMLQRVGVNVRHIESYQPDEGSSVYWARDFREIVGNAFPGSERISKQT
jgi:hypothetical protein